MAKTVSVVVPVYNNRETLAETCEQIFTVRDAAFADLDLEIVFVNDGSTDGSWPELLRLKERHDDTVTLLNLSRNWGQHGALLAGFGRATGDAVICVSADLQDPIELIGEMVERWRAGTEIVVCHRAGREEGWLSRLGSAVAYSVARRSYPVLPKGGFDYWLMSRRVCRMMAAYKGRHNFLQGNLLATGFSRAFIPYTRRRRNAGKSGYTLWRKAMILVDFVFTVSYLPIRLLSAIGVLSALGGFVYSLLIVYAWFRHETPVPGWAPLMIVQMVLGGLIMLMLGVIGEYLWRIYDNLKDFPLYIVDERLAAARAADAEPDVAHCREDRLPDLAATDRG